MLQHACIVNNVNTIFLIVILFKDIEKAIIIIWIKGFGLKDRKIKK